MHSKRNAEFSNDTYWKSVITKRSYEVDRSLSLADVANRSLSVAEVSNRSLSVAEVSNRSLSLAEVSNRSLSVAEVSNRSLSVAEVSNRRGAKSEPHPHRFGYAQRTIVVSLNDSFSIEIPSLMAVRVINLIIAGHLYEVS